MRFFAVNCFPGCFCACVWNLADSAVEKSPVATREEAVAHVEPASPAKEVAGVEDAAPAEDTPAEGSTVE